MRWDMTALQNKRLVSLTRCWSWHETRLMRLHGRTRVVTLTCYGSLDVMRQHAKRKGSLTTTHILLVMEQDQLPATDQVQGHSQSDHDGQSWRRLHSIQCTMCSFTHILIVMGGDEMRCSHSIQCTLISLLTFCWSCDKIQWDNHYGTKTGYDTHCLYVMYEAVTIRKKRRVSHSHAVGYGIRCDETAW